MTRWLKSLGFALAILVGATAHAAEPIKVVYHLSDGVEQAARAMQNTSAITSTRTRPQRSLWWGMAKGSISCWPMRRPRMAASSPH